MLDRSVSGLPHSTGDQACQTISSSAILNKEQCQNANRIPCPRSLRRVRYIKPKKLDGIFLLSNSTITTFFKKPFGVKNEPLRLGLTQLQNQAHYGRRGLPRPLK